MVLVQVSGLFGKLLFVIALSTIVPKIAGYPQGAPFCNDGNAAIGEGSYHDAPRGLLSAMGIAVCIDEQNVNENDTFHAAPNSTYTIKLLRSWNGGIEGIFVRLAANDTETVLEAIDADVALTTDNQLLQVSPACSESEVATGITHINMDRKQEIEITLDTTGLPVGSMYKLGITSVDHHDHSYTPYMIHITDGTNSSVTSMMAVNGTSNVTGCQPIASGVGATIFSNFYYTAVLTTVVGMVSAFAIA